MSRIHVQLPADRDYAGLLQLEDDFGHVIAGPYAVCGRANDEAAREHGNPARATTLPYGDTPLGTYRVTQLLQPLAPRLLLPDSGVFHL